MNHPLDDVPKSLKELAGAWAGYAALGSFVLYLCGYLALRFHLMAFGVTSDTAVLDERYLFAGAGFLVYLAAAVPSFVFLMLPVAVPVLLVWRWLPPGWRERLQAWWLVPQRLAWMGVLWTLAWSQFVMRQCWVLNDLLFARELPYMPDWMQQVLLDESNRPLFFAALLGACVMSTLLLRPLWSVVAPSRGLGLARALLSVLVGIQLLMLPVNYGTLVLEQSLPRVAAAGPRALVAGETAWLVWEGKESTSFLVLAADGRRSLLSVDRKQVSSVEVIGFDAILPRLLAAAAKPQPQPEGNPP